MRYLFLLLFAISPLSAQTYDCFLFFNELDLLAIRLFELHDVVDHFVLIESKQTFRGTPKPLYFERNKALFTPYLDKIIHLVFDEDDPAWTAWERETAQRNGLMRGLAACNGEDIVIISDVDEIPRKATVKNLPLFFLHYPKKTFIFEMPMYRYQLNRLCPERPDGNDNWHGPVCCTYGALQDLSPEHLRRLRNKKGPHLKLIHSAGWHFTSIGGEERLREKLESFSHGADALSAEFKALWQQYLESFHAHIPVPVDNTFPLYVQTHFDELCEQGYIAKWD